VQILEVGALARAAGRLAEPEMLGGLDLDDIGAPVGELAGSRRPGAHASQVQHGEACESL
jgi:hypothetical protein